MPDSNLLRLQDVIRRDASTGRAILDRVTLAIDAGERIGLAGPSGSGKSSLLRVIARLDRLDEGAVLFGGKAIDRDEVPRFRREVVYLPQRPALFPHTVRENLQMPFRLDVADRPYDEAVAVNLFDAFGRSATMLDQSAESLSGGEQQIVAMIRALVIQPRFLLCDEPTASLDPETSERFENIVLDWQRTSLASSDVERSFVWTSHNPEQMSRMASRVLKMDAGRLLDGDGR